jgi:hypothetical protein
MSLVKLAPTPLATINLHFANQTEFMKHINDHDCPANDSAEIHKAVEAAPDNFEVVKGVVTLIGNEHYLVVNEQEKYKCFSPEGAINRGAPFYSYVKNAVADGLVYGCILEGSASIFVWEFRTRLTYQIKNLADKNNGWIITLENPKNTNE